MFSLSALLSVVCTRSVPFPHHLFVSPGFLFLPLSPNLSWACVWELIPCGLWHYSWDVVVLQGTWWGHGVDGTPPQKGRRGWQVLAVSSFDKNNLGFTCQVSVQGLMKSKGDVGGSWHGWPVRAQKAAEVWMESSACCEVSFVLCEIRDFMP